MDELIDTERTSRHPSPWWWAVRIPAVTLLLAAVWFGEQGDYEKAYRLLLGIFIGYALVGTPPPLWPRPAANEGAERG